MDHPAIGKETFLGRLFPGLEKLGSALSSHVLNGDFHTGQAGYFLIQLGGKPLFELGCVFQCQGFRDPAALLLLGQNPSPAKENYTKKIGGILLRHDQVLTDDTEGDLVVF